METLYTLKYFMERSIAELSHVECILIDKKIILISIFIDKKLLKSWFTSITNHAKKHFNLKLKPSIIALKVIK